LLAATAPRHSAESRTQKHRAPLDLNGVLSRMDETSRRLRTLSADLKYTKVTVVVDDKSTEQGQFFYAKGKPPEVLIDFKTPDPNTSARISPRPNSGSTKYRSSPSSKSFSRRAETTSSPVTRRLK